MRNLSRSATDDDESDVESLCIIKTQKTGDEPLVVGRTPALILVRFWGRIRDVSHTHEPVRVSSEVKKQRTRDEPLVVGRTLDDSGLILVRFCGVLM